MAEYATKKTDVDAKSVTIEFGDESTLALALGQLQPSIVEQLALHGLGQKLVDSYSGAKKAVEEGEATSKLAYAKEQVARVIEQLVAGEWSARREAGGPRVTLLAQAVARALGIEIASAVETLNEMSEAERKAVSKANKVVKAMAQIKLENEQRKLRALAEADESEGDDVLESFVA